MKPLVFETSRARMAAFGEAGRSTNSAIRALPCNRGCESSKQIELIQNQSLYLLNSVTVSNKKVPYQLNQQGTFQNNSEDFYSLLMKTFLESTVPFNITLTLYIPLASSAGI